jgi:hypothetical protein
MKDIKVKLKNDGTVTCVPHDLVLSTRPKRIEWYKDTSGQDFVFTSLIGLPIPPFDPPQISAKSVTVQYHGQSKPSGWGYTISVEPVEKEEYEPHVRGDGSGTIRNH